MLQGTDAAPELPLEIFLTHFSEFRVRAFVCKFLRKDAMIQKIEFRCRAVSYVRRVERVKQNIAISINMLVTALDCPRNSPKSALGHGLEPPGNRGKHDAVHHDRELPILD
jgi:hypothetical protein